ncbi:hypothetical protein [Glycocaulis sp.]|uniref:hypothetical protein n=1 Tax=Glycocaulis sp. TaxID=1969725 RepID=UPI003F7188B3
MFDVDIVAVSIGSLIVSALALCGSFYIAKTNIKNKNFDAALKLFELSDKIYSRYLKAEKTDIFAVGQVVSCLELEAAIMNKKMISDDVADVFRDSLVGRIKNSCSDPVLMAYVESSLGDVDNSSPDVLCHVRSFIEGNWHCFNEPEVVYKHYCGRKH